MGQRTKRAAGQWARANHKEDGPLDPAVAEKFRRNLGFARIYDYIDETLAKFPALSEQQRCELAELLAPVRISRNGGESGD